MGCTCHPKVTYHARDPKGWIDGPSITVAHDGWCPMIDRPSSIVAYNEPGPHR